MAKPENVLRETRSLPDKLLLIIIYYVSKAYSNEVFTHNCT